METGSPCAVPLALFLCACEAVQERGFSYAVTVKRLASVGLVYSS